MKVVRWLTEHGVSLLGSRVLTVRGRKTGNPQSVPVNLLTLDGERFLVAPRGNTQWVRNVRAAGEAELRVGRRVETVRLVEVPADQRVPVLRVYLKRWGWEVGHSSRASPPTPPTPAPRPRRACRSSGCSRLPRPTGGMTTQGFPSPADPGA